MNASKSNEFGTEFVLYQTETILTIKTMNYFKIDVIGSDGYSFMVCTDENNEDAIIDLAAENGLFQDADDADRCMVDSLVDEQDIEHFKNWNCLYEI